MIGDRGFPCLLQLPQDLGNQDAQHEEIYEPDDSGEDEASQPVLFHMRQTSIQEPAPSGRRACSSTRYEHFKASIIRQKGNNSFITRSSERRSLRANRREDYQYKRPVGLVRSM